MPDVFSGVPEFEAAMKKLTVTVDGATRETVGKGAHMIEASAKAHASGRPGPKVKTGTLRRSIHVEGPVAGAGGIGQGRWIYSAQIGPSVIYGRRVELGYKGSACYPYMAPAVDDVGPHLESAFVEAWAKSVA